MTKHRVYSKNAEFSPTEVNYHTGRNLTSAYLRNDHQKGAINKFTLEQILLETTIFISEKTSIYWAISLRSKHALFLRLRWVLAEFNPAKLITLQNQSTL